MDASDVAERAHWDDYMRAHKECLVHKSTDDSPWFVVPADDKKNARLIVAHIVVETLESMAASLPELTPARRAEIADLRSKLESERG